MKKILLSITSVIFAGAMLVGGTGAILSKANTPVSTISTTTTIDLKIDNESYVTNTLGQLVQSTSTSWTLSGLPGKLFFNFGDLKPGDVGEDTISLHVNENSWACMNINLTGTGENGQSEPEAIVDSTGGVNDGELQNNLYITFWADDGDNVFEIGESVWKQGWVKDIWDGKLWTIADSKTNIWGGTSPIQANVVKYIGKAWCFGAQTATPVLQDGLGKTGSNGPLIRGTGFSCVGDNVGNASQSDSVSADLSFYVVQSQNNNSFICGNNQGGEYCSPGYWKQDQHFDNWTGYSPNQIFSSVFGRTITIQWSSKGKPGPVTNPTLLQALEANGGGINLLARVAVDALLNAAKLNSGFTTAQVISTVQIAIDTNNYGLVNQFTITENCPLN